MLFFYNSGCVLFIPHCHMNITLPFFSTLDGCCLFLILIWTSLFILIYNAGWVPFIPDCDVVRCRLFLIVIWPSLLFFYNSAWVLFIPNCDLDIPIYSFHNAGWVPFIPDCHLDIAAVFFSQLWLGVVYSQFPTCNTMWHGMDTLIPSNTHCPMQRICKDLQRLEIQGRLRSLPLVALSAISLSLA